MTFNAAAVEDLFSGLITHAQTLGLFEDVITHEPKSAPKTGLSCAFWLKEIVPLPALSGLAATSGRVLVDARIYKNMLARPEDQTDRELLSATLTLIGSYSGDFDLNLTGDGVMQVDLLGSYGQALEAECGYMEMDGKFFRVAIVHVPVIIDSLWTQAA